MTETQESHSTTYNIHIEHAEGLAIGDGARVESPAPRPVPRGDLPPNPFTDRLAVHDPARFIGRADFLRRLRRDLKKTSVAIVGERKIGKSSVLWQLKRELEQDAACHVFFWDLFDPLARAGTLLAQVTRRLGGSGSGWAAFKEAIQGQRVILLLDELDLAPARGFDVDLLRGFRSLHNQAWDFRLVTASRRKPRKIFPRPKLGSYPDDFLRPQRLDPFPEAEALRLLHHPWAPDAPHFDRDTCAALLTLSGRHPFRLQLAAHHRYEALADPAYDWRRAYEEELEEVK